MKKFFKIFFSVLAGLFLLILLLPFLFKGQIELKVKEVINEEIDATVSWERFSLSLIRNFPDLRMGLDDFTIVNDAPFEGDTLVNVKTFAVAVDLMSAIRGESINVKSVLVDAPYINLKMNSDSIDNWDIVPMDAPAEEDIPESAAEPAAFNVQLQSVEVKGGRVFYRDDVMNMSTSLKGFDIAMQGDLTESSTTINLLTSISEIDFAFEGVNYLSGVPAEFRADIAADLANMIFEFRDNELDFSGIPLFMEGSVALLEDDHLDLDLRMAARQTDFSTLLALVPEEFMKDFEELETVGSFEIEAVVKGIYEDENNLPAFDAVFAVNNGGIQYPDLPKSIDNINISLLINNPGGEPDLTVVDLKQFHFAVGSNPFDAQFRLSTPVSNAVYKGMMKGTIDLASFADAIPMDDIDIKGLITADLTLDGDYNMIENEAYEDIEANGTIRLADFEYISSDLPSGFAISSADFFFSPRYLELRTFESTFGSSDFSLTGRLENYLGFLFNEGTIKGRLDHRSQTININELMALAGEEPEVVDEQEPAVINTVMVPGNIDFTMTTNIGYMIFDKLDITNTQGSLVVKDSRVVMNGVGAELLNGRIVMNGQYNTQDTTSVFMDFDLGVNNMDINKAANSFSMVDSLMPVAKNATGQVSSELKFRSLIGEEFDPILHSFNGHGRLWSNAVEVSETKSQDALARLLGDDKYRTATVSDLDVNFVIENGDVIVEPFDVRMFGKNVNIEGTQSLDQTMNFTMRMPVSREELSGFADLFGGSFSADGDDIMVGIDIKGSVSDPNLSVNTEALRSAIRDEIKREAGSAVEDAIKRVTEDEDVKKKIEETGRRLRDLF
ncbi:AsmA-like C-terminal region-containing protein [Marinilabiliaceae bacterium ANBcel2]|nr:AsmA-like C-terminal region-containing protein [Marinilabiliaceae bacterium ANBcel2]